MGQEPIPHTVSKGAVSVMERLRSLDRSERHAVLATEGDGQPYTSLIAYALDREGRGILFATPRKTVKYRCILKNPRVSLLIDTRSNSDRDYMKAEAITIQGTARPVRRGKKRERLAGILIRKHPHLSEFIQAPTTALVLVDPSRYIHVSRFQTVTEQVPGSSA